MNININFSNFKKKHKAKKNQVLFHIEKYPQRPERYLIRHLALHQFFHHVFHHIERFYKGFSDPHTQLRVG